MRTLLVQWIQEGLSLSIGEEIYIPVDNKQAQLEFEKQLRKELRAYSNIDPVGASKLRVSVTFKDSRYWVVLKKIYSTPLTAYKRGLDGTITKIEVMETKEQERIKKFMEEENGMAQEK